ncbi:MAG: glycosyltransferase [Candidatus Competibacteraceae bacterium]|nr:glycosyltransferase [Candidatus Competibacteraceae bacterium]
MSQPKRLAVLVASLAVGGVGRVRVHLLNELIGQGLAVDLLVARTDSPYMHSLRRGVRVIHLKTSHAVFGALPFACYLRRHRPDAVLTERIRVNAMALRACRLAGSGTPVFTTLDTHLSRQLDSLQPAKKRKHLRMMRRYYPFNAGLIAVSDGVADDAAALIGYPRASIRTIPNPVVTPQLHEQARIPLAHPWFQPGQPPVILAVGRLEPQKDFATLLRAFAKLRRDGVYRLMILGEGKLRPELFDMASDLGIQADLQMPGFVENPYVFMARASLFVLSSAWEGSGNALTEALAVGTPAVATDCPSGPRETLADGRYGPLVPVGDADALAEAMRATLRNPPNANCLQSAVGRYTVEASAQGYLTAMGLV